MNNLKRLNEAMEYIEDNLTDEIDMAYVGKIALCSEFHFSKMFSYLAQMPLSEYIRKRRLSLAGEDLKNTNLKVIDVAIKYSYTSADSFSRAFNKMHNILPSQVKDNDIILKSFPKLSFEINITGGIEMEYRIVKKDSFNIIGLKKRVTITYNGVNEEISSMYKELTPQIIEKLKKMSDVEPEGMISASLNFHDRHIDGVGQMDHIIGVASSKITDEFFTTEIPAQTWVVFISQGPFPKTLQETWTKIYGQWFPSSNYAPTGGAELTWHESQDLTKEDFKSEIWIPVVLTDE